MTHDHTFEIPAENVRERTTELYFISDKKILKDPTRSETVVNPVQARKPFFQTL